MNLKENLVGNVLAQLALPLALCLAACSGADTTTDTGRGYNPGNGSGSNNPGTGGSGQQTGATAGNGGSSAGTGNTSGGAGGSGISTGGSGGSTAGSGTGGSGTGGTSPAGGSGGTGTAGSGAAGSGTAGTGGTMTIGGIAIPASDLAPPDPADGIQFATPAGAYTVNPGQEIFPNYGVTVADDISVGGFQSFMTEGSSHHFIVYMGNAAAGGQQWVYATSTPGAIVGMNMPDGVGLDMAKGTALTLNLHFINTGTTPVQPQVKLNVLYAKNVQYKAGTMVSFNLGISVPAHGTQTVTGSCTASAGSKFFVMSTHTHKNATAAYVNFIHNGQTTEIVHTGDSANYPTDQVVGSGTDWEHPGVGAWSAPDFLTIGAGDSFTYGCSYQNNTNTTITVGETAASNEMCMAIGYYFPKGTASCR